MPDYNDYEPDDYDDPTYDDPRNIGYQMGYAAGVFIAESKRLQRANAGRWRVSAEFAGRVVSRTCGNWAGARLALSLLEKRGGRFLRYERIISKEPG